MEVELVKERARSVKVLGQVQRTEKKHDAHGKHACPRRTTDEPPQEYQLASQDKHRRNKVQPESDRRYCHSCDLADRSHVVEDEPLVMQRESGQTGACGRPMVLGFSRQPYEVVEIWKVLHRLRQ